MSTMLITDNKSGMNVEPQGENKFVRLPPEKGAGLRIAQRRTAVWLGRLILWKKYT